jgi:RNA polymerase sigma factor (sigma-70 family)
MEYKTLTTASLVERCVKKDPLAWAEFVTRYTGLITLSVKKALSTYTFRGGAAEEDVKDIRQNVLSSLWAGNKLAEIRKRDNINYWLAITSRNAAINFGKSRRKEVLVADESSFEKIPSPGDAGGDLAEPGIHPESEALRKCYRLLSSREKVMFQLFFKKDVKLKDIAAMMHLPVGTVTAAITRIRRKIKGSKT